MPVTDGEAPARGSQAMPDAGPRADAALGAAARRAIRIGSGSFAAAVRLFAAPVREDATLLYLWCRHCDDAIDGQELGRPRHVPDDPSARLAELRAGTRAALDAPAPDPAQPMPFRALAVVRARHPIPARLPLSHLDGFAMDARGFECEGLDALLAYCDRVAGDVGEMLGAVMGVRDRGTLARARDLGRAFQLTNIARDVVDDARIGRVYLPRPWLAEAGLSADPAALVAPHAPWERPALAAVVARLLDAAEPFYASARIGLRALPPRSAWAVGTALSTYRAIGLRVRGRGPAAWDARVSTSSLSKLACAAGALPVALARGVRRVSVPSGDGDGGLAR